jgi:hypothetical protein
MSLHSYQQSRELLRDDPPFSALIMAAMRKADTINSLRLKSAFPAIAAELQARYDAPGGLLPGEEMPVSDEERF